MPHAPKAYGYCRLSKEETTIKCSACKLEWSLKIQDDEQTEFDCPFCEHTFVFDRKDPLSIQAQTDRVLQLAAQRLPRNVDPTMEIFSEINVSGGVPIRDRAEGGKLLQKLRTGDYLILPFLDRGFRDLADWCNQAKFFRQMKIHLIVGDFPGLDIHDANGELMLNIMAMFAQWYREQVSRHTKAGLAKRKSLGLPVSSQVPRGYSLMCTHCEHVYDYERTRKGQSCPGCKTPRRGNTTHIPNPNEQQIMWRLLWERSAYFWKDWDQVVFDLNADGIRTREGRKVTQNWARDYWYAAVELLSEEKLLLEHRPPKMENFSIHKIGYLPKHIAEKLEAKSRELAEL